MTSQPQTAVEPLCQAEFEREWELFRQWIDLQFIIDDFKKQEKNHEPTPPRI